MQKNFWQKLLEKNHGFILGSSPMDGVTDNAWRAITKKYGRPDVMFTEFVNVEGLSRAEDRLRPHLATTPYQAPVIAQLYGLHPDDFRQAARLVRKLGLAGIDINMGCPARTVALNGAGAGLIQNKLLAKEIFFALRTELADSGLPLSIKTRLGWNQPQIEDWIGWILTELRPDALTIHARTYKQAYSGQADWSALATIGDLARRLHSPTVIFGNGDLKDRTDACDHARRAHLDGALIGRSALGQPWVFLSASDQKQLLASTSPFQIMLEHARLFEQPNPNSAFLPMRKHLAAYTKGFPNASAVRVALCTANSADDVAQIINPYIF